MGLLYRDGRFLCANYHKKIENDIYIEDSVLETLAGAGGTEPILEYDEYLHEWFLKSKRNKLSKLTIEGFTKNGDIFKEIVLVDNYKVWYETSYELDDSGNINNLKIKHSNLKINNIHYKGVDVYDSDTHILYAGEDDLFTEIERGE